MKMAQKTPFCVIMGCFNEIHKILIVNGEPLPLCKGCYEKTLVVGPDTVVLDFSKTREANPETNQIM